MEIKQTRDKIVCCNCMQIRQGYKILYSTNNSTMTYLCDYCTKKLTKVLNNHSADEWLRNESN